MGEMSSTEILHNLAKGQDEAAWAQLIARHGPAMYRTCLAVLNDRALAEDAVQEAFLVVRDHAARFTASEQAPQARAAAWLQRVACTAALQLARGRRRQQHREKIAGRDRTVIGDQDHQDPAQSIEVAEQSVLIRQALLDLPERYRRPLVLHYYGGLGYDDLAHELGCTINSARVQVHRCLQRLRGRLTRVGVTGAVSLLVAELEAAVPAASAQTVVSAAPLAHLGPLLTSPAHPAAATVAALSGGVSLMTIAGITTAAAVAIGVLTLGVVQVFSQEPKDQVPPVAVSVPDQEAEQEAKPLVLSEVLRQEIVFDEGVGLTAQAALDIAQQQTRQPRIRIPQRGQDLVQLEGNSYEAVVLGVSVRTSCVPLIRNGAIVLEPLSSFVRQVNGRSVLHPAPLSLDDPRVPAPVRRALNRTIDHIAFDDVPLVDVLMHVQEKAGVPVVGWMFSQGMLLRTVSISLNKGRVGLLLQFLAAQTGMQVVVMGQEIHFMPPAENMQPQRP